MTARTDTVAAEPLFLEISRVFDAPTSLVFKMWSSPEHLARWWGPKNFTATSERFEFRDGGRYRHVIHGPNDHHYGMSGTYLEIVVPEKIVFTFAWDDENGLPGDQSVITVRLHPEGTGTRMTFHQTPFADIETRDSHMDGWGECLDRLSDALAGRPVA